jgi:hypothetical protein
MSGIANHTEFELIEKKAAYLKTIKQIRASNFKRNLPFLILSEELPEGQMYLEFPDGRIEIQQMAPGEPSFQFDVVKALPSAEADEIRKTYGLR